MWDFLENITAFQETILQRYSCFRSYHGKVCKGSPKGEKNCWHLHFTDGYKSMERLNPFHDVLQEASLRVGTRASLSCRSSAPLQARPWSSSTVADGADAGALSGPGPSSLRCSGRQEVKGTGFHSLDLPWKRSHEPLVGNTLREMSPFPTSPLALSLFSLLPLGQKFSLSSSEHFPCETPHCFNIPLAESSRAHLFLAVSPSRQWRKDIQILIGLNHLTPRRHVSVEERRKPGLPSSSWLDALHSQPHCPTLCAK